MTNNLNKFFDVDGEPSISLTAEQLFEACVQLMGAVYILKNSVENQLTELRALGADLKIKLDERN